MKCLKRIIAIVLCFVMISSGSVNIFAETDEFEITETSSVDYSYTEGMYATFNVYSDANPDGFDQVHDL